jgi:hypothetical protein
MYVHDRASSILNLRLPVSARVFQFPSVLDFIGGEASSAMIQLLNLMAHRKMYVMIKINAQFSAQTALK